MPKNKEKTLKAFFNQLFRAHFSLKNSLIFIVFSIFFISAVGLTIFFIWKKGHNYESPKERPLPEKVTLKREVEKLGQTTATVQSDLQTLLNRIKSLEDMSIKQEKVVLMPDKVIADQLILAILGGKFPLETLRVFLQKRPVPWKEELLIKLSHLGEIKCYAELEDLLKVPLTSPSHSLWQRVKNKLKSLISIRKLDGNGNYASSDLKNVQDALRNHNIQKALDSFLILPPEQQAFLAPWKKLAQDRFDLEMLKKKLLEEIAME